MSVFVQFLIGLLFGVGLIVAGMSDPAKVLNFLDLAAIGSTWDASLILVMGAAIAVTFTGYRLVLRRSGPVFGGGFDLPRQRNIDAAVVVGPAIFGIGWGITGLCPGPAFTLAGTGRTDALLFMLAMMAGMLAARLLALRIVSPPVGGISR